MSVLEQSAPEILRRMPDELVIGERLLLTDRETQWLRTRKPVGIACVWECLAALIVERRRRYRF